MSFQAWVASWSAYTVATSGRIVLSSSSRAILPSSSADGASLIIGVDGTHVRDPVKFVPLSADGTTSSRPAPMP